MSSSQLLLNNFTKCFETAEETRPPKKVKKETTAECGKDKSFTKQKKYFASQGLPLTDTFPLD